MNKDKTIEELAMLIRRLSHAVKVCNPHSKLPKQAMEYLERHNLQSNCLRDTLQDKQ